MAGLDGNLIVFIYTVMGIMNWFSLDITREQSIKMYYKVLPTGQEMDSVKFLMGNWGSSQGALGLLLLGVCVIPACNGPEGVNCVSGDTAHKEVLIMLSAMACTFVGFLSMMLATSKAKALGFNIVPMVGWAGVMTVLAVLTILAATDAPAINRDADGEADNVLFTIICAIVGVGTVAKGSLIKVEAPRDGKEETPAAAPAAAENA